MRNEPVYILILAYVIGFTTAYIAFANQPVLDQSFVDATNFSAEADKYRASRATLPSDTSSNAAVGVLFKDTGMYAEIDDEEIILSGKLQEPIEPGPGFHVAIPFYELSPSGQYIYYCEQEELNPEVCNEYIYEVATHHSHTITVVGVKTAVSTLQTVFSWNDDDSANYANYTSPASEPWKFTKVD